MAIKRIPRQILNTHELVELGNRLYPILREASGSDTHLAQLTAELSGHAKASESACSMRRGKRGRPRLMLSAANRDKICTRLGRYVSGMRYSVEPPQKQAGDLVYAVLKRNGFGRPRQSYAARSTAIKAILDDLTGPEMQAAISEIDAGLAVSQLAAAQADCERLEQESIAAEAPRPNPTATGPAMLRQDLYDIISHLNSRERLDPLAYAELNPRVNEMLSAAAAAARARLAGGRHG
jgi:hypothetical protein